MYKNKYILFDLDGTLTDPALGITKSIEYSLNKFGIKVNDRKELYCFIGPPLIDSFMEFYGFEKSKAEIALKYYREYFSVTGLFENNVYDGIENLLSELKEKGYKLVLATSKPEEYAKRILEHFNLLKYFYFVGGASMDEVRNKKEQVIEYALENISYSQDDIAVMVGDRCYDIIGGKQFSLKTVGVLYGYGDFKELYESKADYIAQTVNDLKKILLNI